MEQSKIIDLLEETKALLSGHFELRSGLHSNQFFQCAHLMKYPRKAQVLCDELAARLTSALGDGFADAVISPALGGITVGHEMGRALDLRHIFAEKDADGNLELRRGFRIEKGQRFVVAEDVVTRGGRVQETIDIVEAHGGVVVAVALLVDRSGGKATFCAPMFSLLQATPVTWDPSDCPLCKAGGKAEHPGS